MLMYPQFYVSAASHALIGCVDTCRQAGRCGQVA